MGFSVSLERPLIPTPVAIHEGRYFVRLTIDLGRLVCGRLFALWFQVKSGFSALDLGLIVVLV